MGSISESVDRYFRISERGSTIQGEIRGGIVTFLSMSYVLVVNPEILAPAAGGYDFSQLFTATALAAIIACLLMGLYSRFPVALAPGMGVNAFLSYTVCLGMGFSYEQGLAAVLISGALFLFVTATGWRKRILDSIPMPMRMAITAGIGFFVTVIGLYSAGLIEHGPGTAMSLGNLGDPGVLLSVFCIAMTVALWLKEKWYAVITGLLATWVLGLCLNAGGVGSESSMIPSVEGLSIIAQPDFGLFGKVLEGFDGLDASVAVPFAAAVGSLFIVDMFDTAGTLIGVGKAAGLMDDKGNISGVEKALTSDAVGSVAGAVCGASTTTSFVESTAGIAAGARTGLMPVVVAALFSISMLFAGFFSTFTGACTVGALVLVGIMMFRTVEDIEWRDPAVCVSSFLTITMMGLAGSITDGIAFGTISYAAGMALTGRMKEVPKILWILSAAFMMYYAIAYVVIPSEWI